MFALKTPTNSETTTLASDTRSDRAKDVIICYAQGIENQVSK